MCLIAEAGPGHSANYASDDSCNNAWRAATRLAAVLAGPCEFPTCDATSSCHFPACATQEAVTRFCIFLLSAPLCRRLYVAILLLLILEPLN